LLRLQPIFTLPGIFTRCLHMDIRFLGRGLAAVFLALLLPLAAQADSAAATFPRAPVRVLIDFVAGHKIVEIER
jgi:hypothetical protein